MSITFSIIVPIYNVQRYLRQCLDSIINQTFRDFEILCVDDCGSDNSMAIVEEYAKKDSRIRIFNHDKNRGLSAARNTALENAQGEYIVCVDSDDWLEENALEVIYNAFREYKTNSIFFDYNIYDEITKTRTSEHKNRKGFAYASPGRIGKISDYSWIKAYKKTSITDYNIKWPEGLLFEDGQFHYEYYSMNPKFYVIEDCLYNYRTRSGSIVSNARIGNTKIEDIYQVVRNIKDFYVKYGIYNKYKIAIFDLLNKRITTCKNICNNYQKSLLYSNELLKDFGYPDEFEEFKVQSNVPEFSIILPVYNVEKYIKQCLGSIVSQTYNNFEVLCVDDCGTDKSMEIVEKYAENDSRIKIIRHNKNKGLGAARNTALKNAIGKYIVCVDSDDWLQPNCLERLHYEFIDKGVDSVWYKANVWWEHIGTMTEMTFMPDLLKLKAGYLTIDENNITKYPAYAWNKAYKRLKLIEHNIKWSEGVVFEDISYRLRTGICIPEVYVIDENLYVYRRRDDSIIGNCINNPDKAKDLFKVSEDEYKFLKKNKLLKKYYNSFLRFTVDNINMFRSYPEIQKKLLPYMKKFLDQVELNRDLLEN